MKGFSLMFLTVFLTLTSFAQLTKNNWLVGGSGKFYAYQSSYNSSTYNTASKLTDIDISANLGYFIADKLAFGLRPAFSSWKGNVTTLSGGRTNSRRYSVGPFGRFYFLPVDKPYNLLADAGFQYGISTVDNKKIGHFNNYSFLFGPAIYFNDCIAMEFLMGYSSRLEHRDEAYEEKMKGFQFSIGFQIHLEK